MVCNGELCIDDCLYCWYCGVSAGLPLFDTGVGVWKGSNSALEWI